jgi:prepilin-type N-terminal cleavage/methylation domain-containing protein
MRASLRPLAYRRSRAFTIIELLVVLCIMTILIAGVAISLRGNNSSGQFDKALGEISGVLEQGRAYAVAQSTYVWVVLYQNSPANGEPLEVYAAAFASSDGTDPFNWAGSVTFPPGTVGTTTLTQITRIYHEQGVHLQTTTLPNGPTSPPGPTLPATVPSFQITAQSDAGPVTLSSASTVYWLVQFTPTGAARVASYPIDSVWMGFQRASTQTILDAYNIASMKVNGITGSTTVYRK